MFRLMSIGLTVLGIVLSHLTMIPVAQAQAVSTIVVSEVQTGGINEAFVEDGRKEFVELYNLSASDINITGWKVQYFAASREDVFETSSSATRELATLEGTFHANGYLLLSFENILSLADGYFGQGSTATSGLLARSGGHIRIVNNTGEVVDVFGWGTAKNPETTAVTEIPPSSSAVRKTVPESLILQDTNNNSVDFETSDVPTPTGGAISEIPTEPEPEEDSVPVCDGVIISELLPNPNSDDAGKEFIELYNPTTDTIFLEDCTLKTSGSSKIFEFTTSSAIASHEYKAFYNSVTGLTLPNAADGEVLLSGTNEDYAVQYAADLDSDIAWAYVNSQWVSTNQPTPNATNKASLEEPEVLSASESLASCPEGKFRNLETNRCKNILVIGTSLTPCRLGQTRNPETNRCRNITTLANSLVPCGPNQERNPETNRCRQVAGAATATPCEEGYERNPETNRCRKVQASLATSPSVGNGTDEEMNQKLNYAFMSFGTVVVLGYGAYEYRRDLSNLLERIKSKLRQRRAVQ